MINLQNNKKEKGFSMGEVLISVFILGVTMVTILQLFVTSLKNFAETRDSIIASMLAQEGIELVKNIRDNNWVNGNLTFNNIEKTDNYACAIDIDNISCGLVNRVDCKFPATAETNCSLYFNNNKYTYADTGTKTKFKREVEIKSSPRIITSKVSWAPGKVPGTSNCNITNKCVFSRTILTKWGE